MQQYLVYRGCYSIMHVTFYLLLYRFVFYCLSSEGEQPPETANRHFTTAEAANPQTNTDKQL